MGKTEETRNHLSNGIMTKGTRKGKKEEDVLLFTVKKASDDNACKVERIGFSPAEGGASGGGKKGGRM